MRIEQETIVHYAGSQFAVTRDDGSGFQFRMTHTTLTDPEAGLWLLEVAVSVGTAILWYPCCLFAERPPLSIISTEQRNAQALITRAKALPYQDRPGRSRG